MQEPDLNSWLRTSTPKEWVNYAVEHLPILLLDHVHLERKAAHTALLLIKRHPQQSHWLKTLSKFAREELRHFELVLDILKKRSIAYETIKAGGYMRTLLTGSEKLSQRLYGVHELLVASIVEARSCERFCALVPALRENEPLLAAFYEKLYLAELRHFHTYLNWAIELDATYVEQTLPTLLETEKTWLLQEDPLFRFHSGLPIENNPKKNSCDHK